MSQSGSCYHSLLLSAMDLGNKGDSADVIYKERV